jgi:NADH dehydrogenase (ubiquinone) Fe-S protein 1
MNLCRRIARALSTQGKIPMYVNGKKIFVDPWYTVWQACQGSAVPVPRFCYQENLPVSGNCRMCLVEVEGVNKPIPSCSTLVSPNMKVKTDSEKSKIAQGGLVEFLLANHPLDCPICDQSGECDLQNISLQYGYKKQGRFSEFKRAVESKDIGPLVKTSMNRCIHCTRCVRFTNAVVGQSTLGATGRGGHKEIGTYIDKCLTNEMSGNIADLCPVGALVHNVML